MKQKKTQRKLERKDLNTKHEKIKTKKVELFFEKKNEKKNQRKFFFSYFKAEIIFF